MHLHRRRIGIATEDARMRMERAEAERMNDDRLEEVATQFLR